MATLGDIVTDNAAPEPALYGLLSSAVTVVNDDSVHWQNSFHYETLDCAAEVRVRSMCAASQAVTSKEAGDDALHLQYFPFEVQADFRCSTMSRRPAELRDLAEQAMEACAQKAVEKEFWDGDLAQVAQEDDAEFPNRYLSMDSATNVTPSGAAATGVKSKYGLALLEQAIADCGCGIKGTIHATRAVASALGLKGKNDRLETNLGNMLVAGTGYSGRGPGGVAAPAGKAWMYATGPVTVRLGEIVVFADDSENVDRKSNTILATASRPAAVTWNSCCHYAVLVDLAADYS